MNADRGTGDAIAWEAALFMIFRLRAMIHPCMPIQPDAYALGSDRRTTMSGDELAGWFVRAPKPLFCQAVRSSAGVVIVLIDALQPHSPRYMWEVQVRKMLEDGLGDPSISLSASVRAYAARAQVPPERAAVLCLANDATQLFSWHAIDRWEREYGLLSNSWALGSLTDPSESDHRAHAEARAHGAVCALSVRRLLPASS